MTDAELIESIENLTFKPSAFSHATHIRFAWALLTADPEHAETRIREGIRQLAIHAGVPGNYKDPLTREWIARIASRLRPNDDWPTFRARETDLFVRADQG